MDCCYAHSDKHWITDPQGVAWEHFHTLDNIPVFNEPKRVAAQKRGLLHASCRASSSAVLLHSQSFIQVLLLSHHVWQQSSPECPVPVHPQLGAQYPGWRLAQRYGPRPFQRLFGRQQPSSEPATQPVGAASAAKGWCFCGKPPAQQELGWICRAWCTPHGSDHHGLRQRRRGGLPVLAWPPATAHWGYPDPRKVMPLMKPSWCSARPCTWSVAVWSCWSIFPRKSWSRPCPVHRAWAVVSLKRRSPGNSRA